MLTTCPNCGTQSPASADSCSSCGRGLYRLKPPDTTTAAAATTTSTLSSASLSAWAALGSRSGSRGGIGRFSPARILVAASALVLLAGTGVSAAFLLPVPGGDDEASPPKSPAPAVSSSPSPTDKPSPSKPSKKPPRSAKPTPPPESGKPGRIAPTPQPVDDIPDDIQRALKDRGVSLDPNGDSVSGNNWSVDSDGDVDFSGSGG
jgi:hypothetical protein